MMHDTQKLLDKGLVEIKKPRKYHIIRKGKPTGEIISLLPSQLRQYEISMGVKFMRHLPKSND